MQKLLPPFLTLILGLGSIAASTTAPIVQWPPGAWRLVGLLPVAVGAALTIVNSRLFTKLDTNIMTFNDPDQLVSSGWFRVSRNPMYLGFLVLLCGIALLAGGLSGWIMGPGAFFLAANWWYIPFEEQRMSEKFGTAYDNYCNGVRRWL